MSNDHEALRRKEAEAFFELKPLNWHLSCTDARRLEEIANEPGPEPLTAKNVREVFQRLSDMLDDPEVQRQIHRHNVGEMLEVEARFMEQVIRDRSLERPERARLKRKFQEYIVKACEASGAKVVMSLTRAKWWGNSEID